MAGITPGGIRYPDGASKAKNLGPELEVMAHDIDVYVGEQIDSENPLFVDEAEEAVAAALAAARIMREQGDVTDLNTVPAISGVLTANTSTLNTPYEGTWTVLHQRSNESSANGTQLAVGATAATNGEIWVRRLAGGVWQPWEQIMRRTDLADAGLTSEKCLHVEAGRWIWDGAGDPAATHYIVRRDGRWMTASSTLPQPSATVPAVTWN